MTEETEVAETEIPESVDAVAETEEVQAPRESKQVPVEALISERRKRQDLEAQMRYMQEQMESLKAPKEDPKEEDDDEPVYRGDLKRYHEKLTKEELKAMRREIAEDAFKDANPQAIKLINAHLREIVEKRPWLAESIETAPNRYARAYEIIQDFSPALKQKSEQEKVAKKIEENSKKPGNPVTVGKPANLSQADYLRSIGGTKEFREYRQKLLGR